MKKLASWQLLIFSDLSHMISEHTNINPSFLNISVCTEFKKYIRPAVDAFEWHHFAPSHDDVIKWKHFRVTGHLCGEFIGPRWIPRTKASDAVLWFFSLICVWINGWVNNRETCDLRRYRAHYDVIVMDPTTVPYYRDVHHFEEADCWYSVKHRYNTFQCNTMLHKARLLHALSKITLGMGSANVRRCYKVTSSLIGWVHTQNDLGNIYSNRP